MDECGKADGGLVERTQRIRMAAEVGLAHSSRGRHWSRALLRRRLIRKGSNGYKNDDRAARTKTLEELGVGREGEADGEEKVVEARVRALQKLVPGGEELGVDRLFEETADYIEALQGQVRVMRALASLLDGIESERQRWMLWLGDI